MARTSKPNTVTPNLVAVAGKAIEAPKGYKIGRQVTVPLKLMRDGEKFSFRPEGEIISGQDDTAREGFDKAMTLCPVIDLSTGESVSLICNTVLESALRRVPGGYVGKNLLALRIGKRDGKRYSDFMVYELEAE